MKYQISNLKSQIKTKEELFSKAMLWLSIFMAFLIVIKIAVFTVKSVMAGQLVKKAVAKSRLDPKQMEKYFAGPKKFADELKKKNLFIPAVPKQNPVKQVNGILGDEVLIEGKMYKVGDKIQDAQIVAIEPTQVRVLWDGKEKAFMPITSSGGASSEPNAKTQSPGEERPRSRSMPPRMEKPPEAAVPAPAADDPLAWMGVKLSPKAREKFLTMWNQMSDEQKEQGRTMEQDV